MAKILLVEDDNNLREIYEARLQAEGYTIVSAKDGEEALVKAKQERPDLIISDVMMPRISGFEMLDILRNTDGMKDVKVIMLTALGQAEDKVRADSLGADRYLVKSQVTLEDIVKAAQELLSEGAAVVAPAEPAPVVANPAAVAQPTASPAPVATAIPVVAPAPAAAPQVATPTIPVIAPTVPTTPQAVPAPAVPVAASAPVVAAPPAVTPEAPATPVAPAPAASIPVATPPVTVPAVAPQISMPAQPVGVPAAVVPASPTPTPETPAAATLPTSEPASTDNQTSDDKLIADAMQNLSATLSAPAPTSEAAPVEPPAADTEATSATDDTTSSDTPAPVEDTVETTQASTDTVAPSSLPDFAAAKPETAEEAVEPSGAPELTTTPAAAEATTPAETSEPAAEPDAVQETEPVATPTPAEATEAPTTVEPPSIDAPSNAPEATPADPSLSESAATEQAAMQAQIEDYIKQAPAEAVEAAPEATDDVPATDDTALDSVAQQAPATNDTVVQPTDNVTLPDLSDSSSASTVVSPTQPMEPQPEPVEPEPEQNPENVSIAHKKVIAPPMGSMTTQPDLKELLAKEGIGDFNEKAYGAPATAPDGTIAPPHPPGHVISPNAPAADGDYNADDPNNIAL